MSNLMHPHRVGDLLDALQRQNMDRSETHIDNAIQSAIESLTDRDGFRPNPHNDRGWWEIEPHALRFLDLEMDEEGNLYELGGGAVSFHQQWATPEIHAANPPETWKIIRTEEGSRVIWIIESEAGQDRYAYGSRFLTKREATAALTAGALVDEHRRRGEYFASDRYVADLAAREEREQRERRKIECAGLAVEEMEQWRALASGEGDGADFLNKLLGWFESARPISLENLTESEARETYRDLSESWGFASDIQDELHRMKYLHIGIERSAVEVLEELAERERYAA